MILVIMCNSYSIHMPVHMSVAEIMILNSCIRFMSMFPEKLQNTYFQTIQKVGSRLTRIKIGKTSISVNRIDPNKS